ncbi:MULTISPECIES: acetolactate synthase small subunit [Laceyella]|jgi:acetolactate synthase small subunit|uniref:Acetolactate synthase small subunit n=2 Tax=Laceyella TaxID=292635 RepID=A0ABY5U1M6_LACSH|nr:MULTISPECIES: acetolactate synthase small subunit [Laceyella]PRZ11731.1 acetolactate synthase small subunit [Laceyella sediminis]TCW34839.1 acetolactate synthase small subunit [Laceyella sacchari]UWE02525.1 acetolactate synthase small subunit [Laceyella sacchari]
MKQTIKLRVNPKSSALARVVGMYVRRGIDIEHLLVEKEERSDFSTMTITMDCDTFKLEQMIRQLSKQIDVIAVQKLSGESH